MIIIGIDPGLSGACAILGSASGACVNLFDLPVARDHKRTWIDGAELKLRLHLLPPAECRAYIEAVHAMPKQGVSSAFQFGTGFGSIIGCLQALDIPLAFVPPTQWKKDLNLAREKSAALDKARLMYPTQDLRLKKHDGRAEALLIAYWAYLKYHRNQP